LLYVFIIQDFFSVVKRLFTQNKWRQSAICWLFILQGKSYPGVAVS
jgi:hypothetical protein